jgi:hypothetical protein
VSELVAGAAAATQRIHKLAHRQAKDKICITLLIHCVEALKRQKAVVNRQSTHSRIPGEWSPTPSLTKNSAIYDGPEVTL